MSLFNKSIKSKFITEIKKELGYFTTWLPGEPVKLGDVGVMVDSAFERRTSLKNLGVKFDIIKDETKSDIKYTSSEAVDEVILVDGNVAEEIPNPIGDAKIEIKFNFLREGAIVFETKGAKTNNINNIPKLEKDILNLKSNGEWKDEWVIIKEVINVDSATILISNSSLSESKLEVGADIEVLKSVDIGDAKLKLKSVYSKDMAFESIAKESLTPLFNVVQLKKKFWTGDLELETIKSQTVNLELDSTDKKENIEKNNLDFKLVEVNENDLN